MTGTQWLAAMQHDAQHLVTPMSPAELRARAVQYRRMASTARMVGTGEALLRLAARFEAFAEQEESASQTAPDAQD